MVTEAETNEMVNGEESGTEGEADGGGFQSSVVGTTWNATKCRKQLGGAVEKGVFEQKVGEEIKTTGFEVGSSLESRSGRHQKFNGILGAAEGEGNESGAMTSGRCSDSRHDARWRMIKGRSVSNESHVTMISGA
jgi:hypothetical protein